MASTYTHYRMGQKLMEILPGDTRKAATHYKPFYDFGLQGPDFFFFYYPWGTGSKNVGSIIHDKNFLDFIKRNKKVLNIYPCESQFWSYYVGLVAHYSLDITVHPIIDRLEKELGTTHMALEKELDRYFMELDGLNPITYPLYEIIPYNKLFAPAIYTFYKSYPGVSEGKIKRAMYSFRNIKKALYAPKPSKGTFLENISKKLPIGDMIMGHAMTLEKDQKAMAGVPEIADKFEEACELAQRLILNSIDYIKCDNIELSSEFTKDFNGIERREIDVK